MKYNYLRNIIICIDTNISRKLNKEFIVKLILKKVPHNKKIK